MERHIQAVTGVISAGLNSLEAKATLKNSYSHMLNKMIILHSIRDGVQNKFKIYWYPPDQVVSWLKKVEDIDGAIEKITTKFSNLPILNNLPQPDLTQKIQMTITEIERLIEDGKTLEEALVKRETYRVIKLATAINIGNIKAFTEKLDKLLVYLKNDIIKYIKVHGEPGSGKRVLIQHLNNHEAIANQMFDMVIWLPASEFENGKKYCSIKDGIQRIVASRLGLVIGGSEDENTIAQKLREALRDVKYLLLFDDFKVDTIELDTIGIPTGTKGSKIVYTTNLPLRSPFGTPFSIKMERLNEGDSWQLFEDILINVNREIKQSEIVTIAQKVVKRCDGHFHYIKTVAQNFKSKKSRESWEHAFKLLESLPKKGDNYMKPMEDFLRFSYDGLNENQKNCFLFSLLYPTECKIPVDCLFDCWEANDLLGHDEIREDILDHLLEMALFKEVSNKQYVTIEKFCRWEAIKILEKHDKYKCLVVREASEIVQNDKWERLHWISLADSGIENLPTTVDCPELSTLFLQKNSNLENIPSSFFDKMTELIVLDLYKAKFEFVLPMTKLLKLRVLYVNGCAMLKLPFKIEGPDNMLEVLDIRGCVIDKLPDDIKWLKHLRRLKVSMNGGGSVTDLLISDLSSLKELIIDVKSDADPKDGNSYVAWCNEVTEHIIYKIDTFKELTTLKFCFKYYTINVIQVTGVTLKIFVPNESCLEHIWNHRNIHYKALQVSIGFRMTSNLEIPKNFCKRDSFVLLSFYNIVTNPVIKTVLSEVKTLIVINDNSEDIDKIFVPQIQHCLVQGCNKIETLKHANNFSNLQTLVLSECSRLKTLFLNNEQAMNIKHLEIRDCSNIEEIHMWSTSSVDILQNLTTLVLHDLRMLKKICSITEWPSLCTLEIHKCPNLEPLKLNNAKKLRAIKVEIGT